MSPQEHRVLGYHGMPPERLEVVLREGLRARLPNEKTLCFYVRDEDVMPLRAHARADDEDALELAKDWGSYGSAVPRAVVLEVDLGALARDGFDVEISESIGPDGSFWEGRVVGPIPPERLRVAFVPESP